MATAVPVPESTGTPQQAPGTAPSVAAGVPAVAAATQGLQPQPGVAAPDIGPAPKAPPSLNKKDEALLFLGSIKALRPAVEQIVGQHAQQQQTRNQHVIDTVWQSISAQTAAKNRVQMQLQPIVNDIDQHMKEAQDLPDSDPTKIQKIGYLAQLHQQVVGEVKQQADLVKTNRQTVEALLADPKNRKILSKAVGYDEKNANTPERQQMIAAIKKSMPGTGTQQANVESQFPQAQSTVPGTGVPEKLQPDVLKASTEQAKLEEKTQADQAKLAATQAAQQATEAYHQATLALDKSKLEVQKDKNNTQAKIALQRNAVEAQKAKAALSTAGQTQEGIDAMGKMLVEHRMAPQELPAFGAQRAKALMAAQKLDPNYNSASADVSYGYAKTASTQNTLNYLDSLTGPDNQSGNLQQLVQASDSLPRTKYPPINRPEQWAKLEAGNPAIASYYATVTEVADQVAKVLQGGTGSATSDAKLKQATALFDKGFNPEQVKQVAATLRGLLANRKSALIGDNPFLQQQFGGGASGTARAKAPAANDPLGILQ